MALRIVPSSAYSTSTTNLSAAQRVSQIAPSAPSAPGLPDALRSSIAAAIPSEATTSPHTHLASLSSSHPLEARLVHWRATQHNLKMEGLRRTFGIAEPVKRSMELGICRHGEFRAGMLGGSAGLSGDVLEGRDERIEWEDIYKGDDLREAPDFHTEMEARLKMNW